MCLTHALSIDVECYYQIFLRNRFGQEIEARDEVVRCTDQILDLLSDYKTKATFFVVGKVAQKFPGLVHRIVRDGHELGSHGHSHLYVNQLSQAEFRKDLRLSKEILEDVGGVQVLGFRAPQFSVDRTTPWAYEVLAEEGFVYDSSIFPFRGRRYGDPEAPTGPWTVETPAGNILEIPMSTVSLGRRRFPIAGGGYLRYFPYWVNSAGISTVAKSGRCVVVYLHPYELADRSSDPSLDVAMRQADWKTRLSHRMQLVNRRRTISKLSRLLDQFKMSSIIDVFNVGSEPGSPAASPRKATV